MRRSVSIVFIFLAVLGIGLPLAAQPAPLPLFPLPFQKPYTTASLWNDLMKGNTRYKGGRLPYTGIADARAATADKQDPPVTVLSCSDSRVPPELIFGRTVGDLFVVRVAGNVADPFEIASIEYAISKGWTKLIVVMGHQSCGAVEEALKNDDPPTPSLVSLVQRIRESFVGLPSWPATDRLERGIKANARSSAAYLLAHSTVIHKAVLEKRVGLIVAYYKLKSGEVEVLQQ
ncbi:MAG TPA: carbonic anhydrase [Thermoanaerobaculia bacterium]|jgi:carbonic anhydrase|nr:carbonic anhydrase [Thermoanaerobaculia bacterium]